MSPGGFAGVAGAVFGSVMDDDEPVVPRGRTDPEAAGGGF